MSHIVDITGEKFGRLVAVKRIGYRKYKNGGDSIWECKCKCGGTIQLPLTALRTGNTRSCGCLQSEKNEKFASLRRTHGMSRTRLYTVWKQMKKRCYNRNDPVYKHYGALGVTVCDEWKNSFIAFRTWMLEHGYDENAKRGQCTLDRINPSGNYCPENCRVVDMVVQRHNRREDKKIDTA